MKKITLLMMSLIMALTVKAQEDVTSLLTNPDFENGTIGWTIVGGGSTIATAANYEYSGTSFIESWVAAHNTLTDRSWSQTIEVPNGVYAIKSMAHAILQSDGSVIPEGVSIYANGDMVAVTTTHTNPPKEYAVATQVTNGKLTVGFSIVSGNVNWAAWDNVRVTQYVAETIEEAQVMYAKDEMNALVAVAEELMAGKIQTALAEAIATAAAGIESVATVEEAQALWDSLKAMVEEAQASSEAYIALQAKIEQAYEWLEKDLSEGYDEFEAAIATAEGYYEEAPLNVEETKAAAVALDNAIFDFFMLNADGELELPMTNLYVTNSTVRSTNTGWTYNPESAKATVSYNIAEFYNKDYDMSQTIEGLPNGMYVVKMTGYYRATGNDNNVGFNAHEDGSEVISAVLYANNKFVPLACLYEHNVEEINAANPADKTIGGYNNFANSMAEAAICFDKGFYTNNEVAVVVNDGKLTFGIRDQGHGSGSWTAFRDFQLGYRGNFPAIVLSNTIAEAEAWLEENAENLPVTAYSELSDAISEASDYTGIGDFENEEVMVIIEKFDAIYASVKNAASLVAKLSDMVAEVENLILLEYPGLQALADAYEVAAEMIEAGYEPELAEDQNTEMFYTAAIAALQEAINAYYESQVATPENPADYTYRVGLPNFQATKNYTIPAPWVVENVQNGGDVWVGTCQPEEAGGAGLPGLNSWSNDFTTMDVHQDIEGLPNGVYTVTAKAITQGLGQQHAYAKSSVGTAVSPDMTIVGWDTPEWETLVTEKVVVTDGKLRIGFASVSAGGVNGWYQVTGFKLHYYGGWDLEDGHLTIWEDYDYTVSTDYPWILLRNQIKSVEFKEGVTKIGTSAFYNFQNIESVDIPSSINYIGNDAFMQCTKLTSVVIPDNVTYLGQHAFHGCDNLVSITLPEGITEIGKNTFYNCYNLTSITIPDNVTSIGEAAFMLCSKLATVNLGQNITEIGPAAFIGCAITSFDIPSNVTEIQNFTFQDSKLLTSVTISENVTSIGEYAFAGCSNLKSITIPASVTEIGNYAFSASGVKDIVSLATTAPTLGEETFGCISFEATLNYPEGSDYSSWMQYFEGDVYYLKNVATGTYLQAGHSWGTLPTLGEDGLDVRINELPNGKYSIATNVSNGVSNYYLGIANDGGIYLDTPISEWTIQQQASGYYTFTLDGSNYMGYDESDEISFTLTDASQPNAQWQLITKEERIAAMTGMSTPTDATFLLPGANFNRNDIRNTSWYGAPTVSGYGDPNGSNFCTEKWNVTAFDVYQEVAVPNGYYRITAQGFYRMGATTSYAAEHHTVGTETLNAILYANQESTPLMSIFEGAQAESFTYGNSLETTFGYVPDEMVSAAAAFAAGLYEHSLLVHVTDGILRIGVKKETGEMGDWAIFDNFNITYYGASFAANEVGALINGTFGDASAASLEGWTIGVGKMITGNHNRWTNFNDGFAEQWVNFTGEDNTLEDIEFYQEVKGLAAGNYIFAISAIACQQSADDSYEVSGIKVYANNDSVAVHTINVDRDATNQLIGAEEIYIPVTIAEGETLRVGVSVKNTDANWIAIDNAKLYCFDQATLIQAVINHANQLIKDNPIVKGITLSALKSEITAANNLEALRGAIATFNTAILSYNQLDALVKEYEGIAQLSAAIAAAKKVLASATATIAEVDEAYIVLEEAVFQYRFAAASLTYPCDITSRYVVNPQMEEGTNGWSTNMLPDPNNQRYENGNDYIHHFIERWVWDGDLGNIYATQAISGLPDGIYRLSAAIIATRQLADDPKGAVKGAYLFINEDSVAVATEDVKPERFEVYADVKGGVIEIGITGTEITANWLAWDNVTLEFLGGYTSGDVNSDDKHTMNDVVMTVNAVLEKPSEKFHPYAADVNDDDVIAMGDVVNILQMVLTEGTHAASYARSRTAAYDSKLAFTTTEATVATGIDCVVPVALSNTGTYSAFQVDVELPTGVELIDIQLSDRAQGTHTVAWNTLSNGMTRVVAYAADNAAFAGNEGDLINFVVKADATLASDATMTLVKGMFVTVTGAEHTIANASITLRAKTTEIENVDTSALSVYGITKAIVIETPEAAVVDIFAIDGKLVQSVSLTAGKSLISVPAGIYVVNNSKVTVK